MKAINNNETNVRRYINRLRAAISPHKYATVRITTLTIIGTTENKNNWVDLRIAVTVSSIVRVS